MTLSLLALMLGSMAIFSWRYAWWRPAVDWRYPRVLMYHMISAPVRGGKFNGLRVSPSRFERQLWWLKLNGFHFFTLSELWERRDCLPPRSVALTFDDGYRDNLTAMLPLLDKYDARATVYVVSDRHDREWSVLRKPSHASGELRSEAKLSDLELVALARSGRVEIGAHTVTHPDLTALDEEQREREILGSRRELERVTGRPVRSFAYPFGFHDDACVNTVRRTGLETAVTTECGIADMVAVNPLRIPRVKISGRDNLLAFVMRVRGGKRGWTR